MIILYVLVWLTPSVSVQLYTDAETAYKDWQDCVRSADCSVVTDMSSDCYAYDREGELIGILVERSAAF